MQNGTFFAQQGKLDAIIFSGAAILHESWWPGEGCGYSCHLQCPIHCETIVAVRSIFDCRLSKLHHTGTFTDRNPLKRLPQTWEQWVSDIRSSSASIEFLEKLLVHVFDSLRDRERFITFAAKENEFDHVCVLALLHFSLVRLMTCSTAVFVLPNNAAAIRLFTCNELQMQYVQPSIVGITATP